jgi:hypothetical protein
LSLQDDTTLENSERLGYDERGVERVRAAIRALFQALMADDRPTRSGPRLIAPPLRV